MSCGLDVVLAPLGVLVSFLLGVSVLFDSLSSVGSVHSKPRMGHGLGQEIARNQTSEFYARIRRKIGIEEMMTEKRKDSRKVRIV